MPLPPEPAIASAGLSAGGILLLWLWAGLGRRRASGAGVRRHLGRRFQAASVGLLPLAALAALEPDIDGTAPALVGGGVAAMAFCAREILDPLLPRLWHHKRLRPFGLMAVALGGLGLGLYAPPAWLPLAAAIVIYHRHISGAQHIYADSLAEIEALTQKLRAQETTLRLERALLLDIAAAPDAWRDPASAPPAPGDAAAKLPPPRVAS